MHEQVPSPAHLTDSMTCDQRDTFSAPEAAKPQQEGEGKPDVADRQNAFGVLRLLFAALVIVAHTPELVDGNPSRELLHRIFETMSFGGFAVNCFFLVSGYLITASWLKQPDILLYLRKRCARIVPAFVVCSAFCVFVVAPLAGATSLALATNLELLVQLRPPFAEGVFAGTPYPGLNGAAWTIAYEFRCYLLAMLLGLLGFYRRPALVAGLVAMVTVD